MESPLLLATAEVAVTGTSWVVTPAQPWPSMVRLYGNTSAEEIALVVNTLALYCAHSRGKDVLTPEDLATAKDLVLPGGLTAVHGALRIAPSCCAGLEGWREWYGLVDGKGNPWLGHDPSPFVEVTQEGFAVWADGGLGEPTTPDQVIRFTRGELVGALEHVARDLAAFLVPFRAWCLSNTSCGEAITHTFADSFGIQVSASAA